MSSRIFQKLQMKVPYMSSQNLAGHINDLITGVKLV